MLWWWLHCPGPHHSGVTFPFLASSHCCAHGSGEDIKSKEWVKTLWEWVPGSRGVALGNVVAEVSLCTLEWEWPSGQWVQHGMKGEIERRHRRSWAHRHQDHTEIAQIFAIPCLQPVLGVALGVSILQRSGSSARSSFWSLKGGWGGADPNKALSVGTCAPFPPFLRLMLSQSHREVILLKTWRENHQILFSWSLFCWLSCTALV